ncbi:unnamed protein product [Protopolystoma xenopodis]|uniref:Uncharacterized protein n=1 Tax=Protopolystoma xenopodis TaxID=117903 RepID=A0A448WPC5_9PLAT|nr:unnamed protein product [Protopolystoma xenopodis]
MSRSLDDVRHMMGEISASFNPKLGRMLYGLSRLECRIKAKWLRNNGTQPPSSSDIGLRISSSYTFMYVNYPYFTLVSIQNVESVSVNRHQNEVAVLTLKSGGNYRSLKVTALNLSPASNEAGTKIRPKVHSAFGGIAQLRQKAKTT